MSFDIGLDLLNLELGLLKNELKLLKLCSVGRSEMQINEFYSGGS